MPQSTPAPNRATDRSPGPDQFWEPKSPRLPLLAQLRERIIDRTAAWLSSRGVTRIALYGAGRHTRPIIRQPWLLYGIEVVAIIDDDPPEESLVGVPVVTLGEAIARPVDVQSLVISSTRFEDKMAERAEHALRGTPIEVVRLYSPDDSLWTVEATAERLIRRGLEAGEARWLVDNRGERHDALLPILPPARTELHTRRYELAADVLRSMGGRAGGGRLTAADLACGTGYGSSILKRVGGAGRVVGMDLDPAAVAYAARRHGSAGVEFRVGDAVSTGIEPGSVDMAASFETIEHIEDAAGLIEELWFVLRPGGRLVISTPNRYGPTPYHVHDFGFPEFRALLEARFEVIEWIGQLPDDDIRDSDLPPGMHRLDAGRAEREDWRTGTGAARRPDFLIAICRKAGPRDRAAPLAGAASEDPLVMVETPFGTVRARSRGEVGEGLCRWLGAAPPGSVLWDASPSGGVLALAAARGGRFESVLALEPSPREHWLLSEAIEANSPLGVRACCVALAGMPCAHGTTGTIGSVARLAGVPEPQYLRVAIDRRTDMGALAGQLGSVRSVWVDLHAGAPAEELRAAMAGAGFELRESGCDVAFCFARP